MYSFFAFESCLHSKFEYSFYAWNEFVLFVREGGHRTAKASAFVKWMEMHKTDEENQYKQNKIEIWNRKKITNTNGTLTGRPNKNENKLIMSKYTFKCKLRNSSSSVNVSLTTKRRARVGLGNIGNYSGMPEHCWFIEMEKYILTLVSYQKMEWMRSLIKGKQL